MSNYIARNVTDDNFEHCATNLLPICVGYVQSIKVGDVIEDQGTLNMLQIIAEVAMAFSIEKYGRQKYRVAAGERNL